MKNLIPHFIHDNFKAGNEKGQFEAVTMFMDIAGFTPMTEGLMQHGKEGAEILNDILNTIFEPAVEAIYCRGGFVTGFAGDALTAVFPTDIASPLVQGVGGLYAAKAINAIFADNRLQTTKLGEFELSVKIGLAYGTVHWGIVGSEMHKTWYFRGQAIDRCALAEHSCDKQEIVIDNVLASRLPDVVQRQELVSNFMKLYDINQSEGKLIKIKLPRITKKIARHFLPEEIINFDQAGEFRNIASVFLSFQEPTSNVELNELAGAIFETADLYGGYVEGLDFGDKGGNSLIIFGAPSAQENTIRRSLQFASDLKAKLTDSIRAGVTYGTVFAGIKGSPHRSVYGVLGNVINLSARMMLDSNWGEIWVDERIRDGGGPEFILENRAERQFKGFNQPVAIFKLKGHTATVPMTVFQREMVGREIELGHIWEFVKPILPDTQNSQKTFPGIFIVFGQPGMGKSRLIYEFRQQLLRQHMVTWCFLPADNIQKKSFGIFKRFLFNFFRQARDITLQENKVRFEFRFNQIIADLAVLDSDEAKSIIAELKRTHSFFLSFVDIVEPGSLYVQLEPKLRYENIILTLINLFKGLSILNPTIISIDDWQWVDKDSQELLRRLTRTFYLSNHEVNDSPSESVVNCFPLAILCTSRYHDDGSQFQLKLDDEIEVHAIDLDVLTKDQIQKLVRQIANAPMANDVIDFLMRKTSGNPFFVEQMILDLMNRNVFQAANDQETLNIAQSDLDTVPDSLNELLITRLDRLTHRVKELVQTAAVIGHEFETVFLLAIIHRFNPDYPVDHVYPDLQFAEQAQIWHSLEEIKYIFRHALLRDAAYEMQLRTRLRTLHKLIAETIERLNPDDPRYYGDLAHHYDKAEVMDKTIEYLEKAGDYARAHYQNQEAIRFYNRFMEIIKLNSDDFDNVFQVKHLNVYEKKALVLQLIGDVNSAEKLFRESIEIAFKFGNLKILARIKSSLASFLTFRGDYQESLVLLKDAQDYAKTIDDQIILHQVIGNLGITYYRLGEFKKALHCFENILKYANEANDSKTLCMTFGNFGNIYRITGHYTLSMEYYQKQLSIAKQIKDKQGISIALGNMGLIFSAQCNFRAAKKCHQQQLLISEELGDYLSICIAYLNLGNVFSAEGYFNNALQCYDRSLRIAEEISNSHAITRAISNLAYTYWEIGDFEKALNYYEMEMKALELMGDRLGQSSTLGNIGYGYLEKGELGKAIEYFDQAIEICSEFDSKYQLTYWYLGKAQCLFVQKSYTDALQLTQKSIVISNDLAKPDTLFEGKLLLVKINFALNPEQRKESILDLERMLTESASDNFQAKEQKAALSYQLGQMYSELQDEDKAKEYDRFALELYQDLYQKTPKYVFKTRIEYLSHKELGEA